MRYLLRTIAAIFLLFPLQATAAVHMMTNGRITIDFADPLYGGGVDSDRIDLLLWIGSNGNSTGNLVANSVSNATCGEPPAFFGQSYSDNTDASKGAAGPFFVTPGVQSSFAGNLASTKTITNIQADQCLAAPQGYKVTRLDGTTETHYTLSRQANLVNAVRVSRTFFFRHNVPSNNFKVYIPRLNEAIYKTVIIPDSTGALNNYDPTTCPYGCDISNWNGIWFADDDGNGNGLAVIRDISATAPALINMDYDAGDNPHATAISGTSISLKVPAGGWTGKLTETEYLCFYDATSWPAANRSAGQLPTGCQVR
jgi:hypothetical protein